MLKEIRLEQIAPRISSEPLFVRTPPGTGSASEVLSPGALAFTGVLASRFELERQRLIAQRSTRSPVRSEERGAKASWEDAFMRESPWILAEATESASQRRCATLGLDSLSLSVVGARDEELLLIDFGSEPEPSFGQVMSGHRKLREASRAPGAGRAHTLAICPRPLELVDLHFRVADEPIGAALVDVGLYIFHCAHAALRHGSAPHLCLSGLQHHLEARWWSRVLDAVEHTLGLARAAIAVTVRIDSLASTLQAHELLYELRERALGFQLPYGDNSAFDRELLLQVCQRRKAALYEDSPPQGRSLPAASAPGGEACLAQA